MQQLRRDLLRALEAGVVGLFLIQAVRFVYATLYARGSSADLYERVPNPDALASVPGVVQYATVQREMIVLGVCLLLPVLALVLHRWSFSLPLAVILVGLGRSMALQTPDLKAPAASLVVGGGLLYLALVIARRPAFFPAMFLLGFTAEQVIRAAGDTYDRTWENDYAVRLTDSSTVDMGLLIALASVLLILLSVGLAYAEQRMIRRERKQEGYAPPLSGVLNLWGGLALGSLLFLELTLLSLPNAIARWSGVEYAGLVPWVLAATALPLVPEVRDLARRFAGMFDGAWRGWLWAVSLGIFMVVARRFDGLLAAVVLVVAQFMVGLTLWWLVQTGIPRRAFAGLGVLVAVLGFGALAAGDYFTYDYAYVRDFPEPYSDLSELLRAFRNSGLALTLVAALMLSIPMILARKRIPWRGGKTLHTLFTLAFVLGVSFVGATLSAEKVVRRPLNPDCLRAATYNIHGGYSQFFDPNLERVADLIELSGSDIVLLQEIETGRMASFGVDQVLWLSRRLEMDARFFPQNEELQGLAVLSRVPIVASEGLLLPSEGNQAAVMHVTLDPDRLAPQPRPADMGYLHVYNGWLGFRVAERDGQPVPEGEQDQNLQLNAMLGWIAAQRGPDWTDRIMLGGTFNHGPDSPLYKRLRMDNLDNPAIKDPFAGLREENAMTLYLVDGTTARYDYLWIFNLPFTGVLIDQSPEAANTSDHRPAIVAIGRHTGVSCPP